MCIILKRLNDGKIKGRAVWGLRGLFLSLNFEDFC